MLSSVYSTTGIPARRYRGGVCRGTLTLKQHPKCSTRFGTTTTTTTTTTSSTFVYAVSIASTLRIYESLVAYERGDVPLYYCTIVGSSGDTTTTSSSQSKTLRMVTNQGTHLEATTPTRACTTTWRHALSAGLSLSITHDTSASSFADTIGIPQVPPPDPPITPRNNPSRRTKRMGGLLFGTGGGAAVTPPYCRCCGSTTTTRTASMLSSPVPLPQYGAEARVSYVCTNCRTGQGLWHVLHDTVLLQAAERAEDEACRQVYRLALAAIHSSSNGGDTSPPSSSSPPPSEASSSSSAELSQTKWVDDDDTIVDATAALTRCLTSAEVTPLRTTHPVVDRLCAAFFHGTMGAAECVEQLGECASNCSSSRSPADTTTATTTTTTMTEDGSAPPPPHTTTTTTSMRQQAAALKTQAFREAGSDMGTAMQLFVEHALVNDDTTTTTTHSATTGTTAAETAADASTSVAAAVGDDSHHYYDDYDGGGDDTTSCSTLLLSAVLDFFLDVCENNDVSAVAFFWPQVCHVHLCMLPATTAPAVARVQCVEQFLITVATKYSIHLALQLVWSHTADLEESMAVSVVEAAAAASQSKPSGGGTGASGSAAPSTSDDEVVSAACRKRRFAVLRFVCELESVLFDFDGGWGGGSVAIGKFLQPTAAHGALLQKTAAQLVRLRKERNPMAMVVATDTSTPAARLRIAQHADYFSCTLNFSRRLAEIAEKLRFAEVAERATLLEQELNILNASGAMGGDPLNRLAASGCLTRVARVPSQEGHVFRSKERTPVLLLMEVMTDTDGRESSESPPQVVVDTAQDEAKEPEVEGSPVKDDVPAQQEEAASLAESTIPEPNTDSVVEDSGNPQSAVSQNVAAESESRHGVLEIQTSGTTPEEKTAEAEMDATDSTPTPATALVGADEGVVPQSPGRE